MRSVGFLPFCKNDEEQEIKHSSLNMLEQHLYTVYVDQILQE